MLLATGSGDGTVRVWDPATGIPVGDPTCRCRWRTVWLAAAPAALSEVLDQHPEAVTACPRVVPVGSLARWRLMIRTSVAGWGERLFYEDTPRSSTEDILAMATLSCLSELRVASGVQVADLARATPGGHPRPSSCAGAMTTPGWPGRGWSKPTAGPQLGPRLAGNGRPDDQHTGFLTPS